MAFQMQFNDPQRDDERERRASGSSGDELESSRREAQEFARAADQAIDEALSQDSSRFVRMNRQTGGQ